MKITPAWINAHTDLAVQLVPPGAVLIDEPIPRFSELIATPAVEFCKKRYGHNVELRFNKRGLHPDDTAAFIRAVEGRHIELTGMGSFRITSCKPKPGGNRYSLFTENRWNDDFYVSLNTENLIHFGAASELHSAYDWAPDQIDVEVGEFDARASIGGRVALLMEAKARIRGSDSLALLLESFLTFAKQPEPPEAKCNHSRKYVELLKQTEAGPILLWLVAAGARWCFIATRVADRIELEETASPSFSNAEALLRDREEKKVKKFIAKPIIEHAVARALLTEIDTRQRVYEHSWHSKDEIYEFISSLKKALKAEGFEHVQPWVWTAETSTGAALTPFGGDTGLELRFSYSTKKGGG